jgi:hypothetical protein
MAKTMVTRSANFAFATVIATVNVTFSGYTNLGLLMLALFSLSLGTSNVLL